MRIGGTSHYPLVCALVDRVGEVDAALCGRVGARVEGFRCVVAVHYRDAVNVGVCWGNSRNGKVLRWFSRYCILWLMVNIDLWILIVRLDYIAAPPWRRHGIIVIDVKTWE